MPYNKAKESLQGHVPCRPCVTPAAAEAAALPLPPLLKLQAFDEDG
jgi:hypothetical protein